jgi:glycosyltransferase involved in cell wall biosynthesis
MGPVHIALIAHSRHPIAEPFAGGLESMTWHLARALLRRGHEVTLFAAEGSEEVPGLRRLHVEPLELSDAARHDPSMPALEMIQAHHAYLQVVRHLARHPGIDLVHNNSLHYLPLVMAETMPAPMLTTLHTPPTPWLESALSVVRSDGLRFAAVSEHTAGAWSHLVDAHVVPNGVDTDLWVPGPGGTDLVWSGRMVPEKAPHHAIEAARRAGLGLRLAGPVSDEAYFRAEVEPLLHDDIRYVGHLGRRELTELVGSSAAALVTPAWDEPYGLVAAEALACGTPVAGYARGGLPEVVGHRVGRLVAGDDVAGLAAALPRVVTLSRKAARAHAVAHCSLDAMVEHYLGLYADTALRDAA